MIGCTDLGGIVPNTYLDKSCYFRSGTVVSYGFVCFLVMFRVTVSGGINSTFEHLGLKQGAYLNRIEIISSIKMYKDIGIIIPSYSVFS